MSPFKIQSRDCCDERAARQLQIPEICSPLFNQSPFLFFPENVSPVHSGRLYQFASHCCDKILAKTTWGERVHFMTTLRLSSIVREVRAGTQSRDLEVGTGAEACPLLTDLLLGASLASFSIQLRHRPMVAPPTVGRALPCQSLKKKIPDSPFNRGILSTVNSMCIVSNEVCIYFSPLFNCISPLLLDFQRS